MAQVAADLSKRTSHGGFHERPHFPIQALKIAVVPSRGEEWYVLSIVAAARLGD